MTLPHLQFVSFSTWSLGLIGVPQSPHGLEVLFSARNICFLDTWVFESSHFECLDPGSAQEDCIFSVLLGFYKNRSTRVWLSKEEGKAHRTAGSTCLPVWVKVKIKIKASSLPWWCMSVSWLCLDCLSVCLSVFVFLYMCVYWFVLVIFYYCDNSMVRATYKKCCWTYSFRVWAHDGKAKTWWQEQLRAQVPIHR